MKKLVVTLFAAALILPLVGQEAKIMIVEKSDSQRLVKAYREYQDALKRWNEVKVDVAWQYTKVDGKTIEGWEKVQFSADFRALVPEYSQYATGRGWTTLSNTNSWVPVTGTLPSSAVLSWDATGNLTVPSEVSVNPGLSVSEKQR